jgi:hypothetical protein
MPQLAVSSESGNLIAKSLTVALSITIIIIGDDGFGEKRGDGVPSALAIR